MEKPAEDSGDEPSATQVDVRAAPPEVEIGDIELAPEAPELERPEPPENRLVRLRRRLAGSNSALGRGLLLLITRDRIDEETWEEFEATLITSDLGVAPTTELVESLRSKLRVEGISEPGRAKAILRAELIKLVDPTMDRTLNADRAEQPAVVMVVGVNGTGKTTTVASLPGCWSPRTRMCCWGPPTPSARLRPTSSKPGAAGWECRPCEGRRGRTQPALLSRLSKPASSKRSTWY